MYGYSLGYNVASLGSNFNVSEAIITLLNLLTNSTDTVKGDLTSTQIGVKADEINGITVSVASIEKLNLVDFSGYNQPYHPSVLYLPNGFAEHKYWMAQSPYPIGGLPYRDRWECPVIYKSQDGVNWIPVANPLDDLTAGEITNEDFFSDPHLVYNEVTGTLECWYRFTEMSVADSPTRILRKTTLDGENWSTREEMIAPVIATSSDLWRSHSIIWDNVNNQYRVWFQNNGGLWYSTSSDGLTWSAKTKLTRDVVANAWHIDVNYYNDIYHLVTYNSTDKNLGYYTSVDGINFEFVRILIAVSDNNALYADELYRACSLVDQFGKIRVYTTAEAGGSTAILLIIAESFNDINF